MFKSQLPAHRPKVQLTVNSDPKVYVNERIAQYLLAHQINGVQFLYCNFKKNKSLILNDEGGSGKCFQCVAFFDAILTASKSTKILIICHDKKCLEHWQYHIDCLIENVSVKVADSENDSQIDKPTDSITIASLNYVLNHLTSFSQHNYDCVVIQDQLLQISPDVYTQLGQLNGKCKIILCSSDLSENLSYFYEVLKFCDQTGPLARRNETLTLDEFKAKFGCNDKSISKRNMAFRQSNLLNACSNFYMRRLCHQCGSQFPPISIEDFQSDFDAWKTHTADTVPNDLSQMTQEFSSPLKLASSSSNQTFNSENDDSTSLLNTACADFSEFDTQMSPLIYSGSEGSVSEDDAIHQTEHSPHDDSQQIMTPEFACNQEHAAKTRARTRRSSSSESKSHTTPVKRALRSNHQRVSPACKRLNYKQLPIRISPNKKPDRKTYLFRTRKHPQTNSTIFFAGDSQVAGPSSRHPSTSSTSEVQVISETELSPISVSSTDDERWDEEKNHQILSIKETQFDSELYCPSPDLFNSFTSAKSEAVNQKVDATSSDHKKTEEKENNATDTFREVFGAPDECDDIDLLSNTNFDIFEITKNSVFDNVLCSADDKITPVRKGANSPPNKVSQTISCLSGLRVVLPRLNGNQVLKIQDELVSQTKPTPPVPRANDDDSVIDLTANDSQKIIELNSDDGIGSREKTPERKQELTPSTRSCLKRNADSRSLTDERRKKSPYARLGWLSTSRSASKCDTPQSRRRLDRWRQRTAEYNLRGNGAPRISRPRNLCNEFKSKTQQKSRYNIPSTSTAQSPIIFSDHE